jgi:hypothetical protein
VQQLLLSQPGIIANITDDQGKTPLDAARVNEKDEAVAILERLP